MPSKEEVWIRLAAGAMLIPKEARAVAKHVDSMVEQWAARFGEAAYLLDGQTECAACHVALPPGAEYVPSEAGIKFCGEPCLAIGPKLAATVLSGQTECATCHRPLTPEHRTAVDGTRFCDMACLVGSGRES